MTTQTGRLDVLAEKSAMCLADMLAMIAAADRGEVWTVNTGTRLRVAALEDALAARNSEDLARVVEASREVRAAHRELPSIDHGKEIRDAGEARIANAHYALDVALARIGGDV